MKTVKTIFAAVVVLAATIQFAFAEDDIIRYGSIRVPTVVLVGIEKGYFTKRNIAIETSLFKSGAEIAPAVATGQVDVAITTSGAPLFNALSRGVTFKIVADALTLQPGSPNPTWIMVRKELAESGEVKGPKDLAGRKLAVTAPGQILDIILRHFMKAGGVASQDFKTIGMPMPDMIVAMESGAIDAAIMVDPLATLAVERGAGAKLVSAGDVVPGLQQGFVLFGTRLSEENRDLGQRFIDGYHEANLWFLNALTTPEGRKEIAEIYQKVMPLRAADLYERIEFVKATPDLVVDIDGQFGLEWQVNVLNERGLLKGVPVMADHVDTGFTANLPK